MAPDERTDVLVLDEFRLRTADTDGSAARIVADASAGTRGAMPLLISIDDPRDVATLRTLRTSVPDDGGARRYTALAPLVAGWQPAKRYRSRIAEHSRVTPTSFRLAVTGSGINDESVPPPGPPTGDGSAGDPVALLLIGIPEDTHAGLLVLVGRDGAEPAADSHAQPPWPLPLTRALGVRVYQSG